MNKKIPGERLTLLVRYISSFSLLVLISGCGIFSPSFEDYEEGNVKTAPTDATTECGAKALEAFKTNVSPAIDSSCANAGCHSSGGGSAQLNLQKSQDDANRSALFSFTGVDDTKLETKFKGTHGGGDQSSTLSKEAVSTWLNAEKACP